MFCEWCGYNYQLDDDHSEGYRIYLLDGHYLTGKFCSMNCCTAQIININKDVSLRLRQLREHYNLYDDVTPARDPKELIKNGGTLSYDQFRKDFVYPVKESETVSYFYSSEEESEEIDFYIEEEDFNPDDI